MDCRLKVGALSPSILSTSSYTGLDRCAFIRLTDDVGGATESEFSIQKTEPNFDILPTTKHLIIDMNMCQLSAA
jgi:hypothetical protein